METQTIVPAYIGKITDLARKAIEDKIFPGCTIGIISQKEEHLLAFGHQMYEHSPAININRSVWDISSITKAIVGTYACSMISDGIISLETKIADVLPIKGRFVNELKLKHLLSFTITLDTEEDLQKLKAAEIEKIILNSGLKVQPGIEFDYRNTTSILLGFFIEKIKGTGLWEILEKDFFLPLNMNNTTFHPDTQDKSNIVPTELVAGKPLRGLVHDETARLLLPRTVASAGIFSTLPDLMKFSKMILKRGEGFLDEKTFNNMTSNQLHDIKNHRYGLSWDKFKLDYCACSCFSKRALIITGFTGCSIMLDYEKNLCIVILSNAVYPHRKPGSMYNFRKSVAESIIVCKHCGLNAD
ncbi:MAG: serine hydrolase [Candidatus Nomurabacteria bacterium]|nr:serine hydrolase [Candidatus Nomurabacteria bacterium]